VIPVVYNLAGLSQNEQLLNDCAILFVSVSSFNLSNVFEQHLLQKLLRVILSFQWMFLKVRIVKHLSLERDQGVSSCGLKIVESICGVKGRNMSVNLSKIVTAKVFQCISAGCCIKQLCFKN